MALTIPTPLAPAVAAVLTSFPPSLRLVGRSGLPASRELAAFLHALATVPDDAPTACDGWTAHELVAHLAAGSREMARLVEARLLRGPGADLGPTRAFEEREAPFRRMVDRRLRRQFVVEALALTDVVRRLRSVAPRAAVTYTGWDMTMEDLVRHGQSELVLHRWDLGGSDDVSLAMLGNPALVTHAGKVLSRMGLPEAVSATRPELMASSADTLLRMWGRDPARGRARAALAPHGLSEGPDCFRYSWC